MARFRLGSEITESRYWEEEKKLRCRICGGMRETWEHIWESCNQGKETKAGWQESMGWVLGNEGEGEW